MRRALGEHVIHPHTRVEHISEVIGLGVVATARIPRGTIVWTQDALDRVLSEQAAAELAPASRQMLERYAHRDEHGRYVLCWDAGKFINHSCDPNLRGIGTWFQVARRDIEPGEEITCDYAECNTTDALRCSCQRVQCRGNVERGDLRRFAVEWDREAHALLDVVAEAEQPLWDHLLSPAAASALIERRTPLSSFGTMYHGI